MKAIYSTWTRFYYLLLLLLILPSNSNGQVISIDEFLQTTMASKEVTETFSYDCPDKFYSSTNSDKYLAIIFSQPKTIRNERGVKDIYIPYKLEIFNSQGNLVNILPKYDKFRIVGFLEGETDYYVFEQGVLDNHEIGIYDMDGNLVKPLNCGFYYYCSPNGKFYYYSGEGTILNIYGENCERLFNIPTGAHQCEAIAVSDSTLLFVNRNTLSYWNINAQKIIWESDIPGKRKGIVYEGSYIQFSIPGNVITLYCLDAYYCFNFQGEFLWADEDYSIQNNRLNCTGVSKSRGDAVIIYTKYKNKKLLFAKIFNHEGILLKEHEIEFGENVKYVGNSGLAAMVFNDYIFIRIYARTADQPMEFATCILYKENQAWNSAVVSGFWYFLNEGSQTERLIGYDSISHRIKGYEVK